MPVWLPMEMYVVLMSILAEGLAFLTGQAALAGELDEALVSAGLHTQD